MITVKDKHVYVAGDDEELAKDLVLLILAFKQKHKFAFNIAIQCAADIEKDLNIEFEDE